MSRSPGRTAPGLAAGVLLCIPLAPGVAGAATHRQPALQPPGSVRVVSTGEDGRPGRASSRQAGLSGSGRWVALSSSARLGRRDHGRDGDVYLADRRTGTVRLLSCSPRGVEGDARSGDADISGTGRWVAFTSSATNLVRGGGPAGVYRVDRVTGRTVLVAAGGRSASISDDGASVALVGADGAAYLVDVATGETTLVSHTAAGPTVPVGVVDHPRISGDGRFVVYATESEEAVTRDANGVADVVRWERSSDEALLVSSTPGGTSGNGGSREPDVSADGDVVVFRSSADDLGPAVDPGGHHVYVRHLAADATDIVDVDLEGEPVINEEGVSSSQPAVSPDGGSVAFRSNGWRMVVGARTDSRWSQVYVRHLTTGRTALVSHDRGGDGGETTSWAPAVSRSGAVVTFVTNAPDVIGHDLDGYPTEVLAYRDGGAPRG